MGIMRILMTGLVAMLFMAYAHAQEYYKWVDADGVTHYGEVLPNTDTEYESFEFPRQYTNSDPSDNYYSIQNQLKRVQEQRLLWRKLNVPERPQNDVVGQRVVYQPEEVRYIPAYPYYYKRHPYKGRYYKKKHARHYGQVEKHYKQPAGKSYISNKQLKMPNRNPALIVKTN